MRKKTAKNGSAELMYGRRGCFYGGNAERTDEPFFHYQKQME